MVQIDEARIAIKVWYLTEAMTKVGGEDIYEVHLTLRLF